jgi:excisionase family DNA binding protein
MHRRSASLSFIKLDLRVLVTVDEAASLLSIGRCTVHDLVTHGSIRSVKVGRNRRIVVQSLHDYVDVLQDMAG